MSKRVCLVRHAEFPTETHIKKNIDALADAGYNVDLICLREPGQAARETYRGGTIARLPVTHRRGGKLRYLFEYASFCLLAALLLTWRSLRQRYDSVEVYNLPDFLVFGTLPAKLLGSKIVFYMFELMPEQTLDEYGLSDKHPFIRLFRWIERRATGIADRVIAVSPYDAAIISERNNIETPPAVILNVPDEALFAKSATPPARNGAYRVLTHGSILRRYGIQTLIRATPEMAAAIPELQVWVLGAGEYRPALEKLTQELGVTDRVRFLGWIPEDEAVPRIIEQADVGVVAALLPRLLPNKLFEYIALDRPAVVAANPSVRMLFEDDDLAYYAPDDERDLARRIIELHGDRERAARLVTNARRIYERHRWAEEQRIYIGVHDELSERRESAGVRTEEAR